MTHWSKYRMFSALPLLVATWVGFASTAGAENWARFRGTGGSGISSDRGIPTKWSPGEYAWNLELPGVGHASPVIWEDKLFVTSAVDEGAVRYLLCLNAQTGRENWSRIIGMNKSKKHGKNSWASSTPTTDGERVYVAFADKERFHLAAFDFAGDIVWRRCLGPYDSRHGSGASPILYNEMVIIPNDQQGPSSLVAFDRRTGKTRWSTLRLSGQTSYSTPFVFEEIGKPAQLICVSGGTGVCSFNPANGNQNWTTGTLKHRTVSSPARAGNLIVQTSGGGGVGKLMYVIDPSADAEDLNTHIHYTRERTLPYVPTPIAFNEHLYLWNDNGVVSCVETNSGNNVWTKRVGGKYSGSPVCVDGTLYIISELGDVVVLAASPEYHSYGKVPLDDPSHSTPAVANGRIYFRTYHRLACLAARQ